MVKEFLETFSDEGEYVGDLEKKESHKRMKTEYFETKKSSIRHKDVKLLLMNSNGRIILQRRSKWKGENSGLWDKTVGGHVTKGDSYDLTMLKECAEELGIPATIVVPGEFEISVVATDLNILGILMKLSYLDSFKSSRIGQDGKTWVESSMTQFYIGYYDGSIRFIDKESCGIQVFSVDELKNEIKAAPDTFTEDVKYILEKFGSKIVPITSKRKHVAND